MIGLSPFELEKIMDPQQTSEVRELTAAELDSVNGGNTTLPPPPPPPPPGWNLAQNKKAA
jgi:hypothetical protein